MQERMCWYMSQEVMTMAVGHCSGVQEGGWHFALQKK